MPRFSYITKDKTNRTVKGLEFASSERELIMSLVRKNLTIISIKEIKQAKPSFFPFGQRTIGTFELMILCKQLAAMIKGGIPLIRAIDAIASEAKNATVQVSLSEVSHHIRDGESFSGSLRKIPRLFSPLFIAMVEAGEKVGALDTMLERLSTYLIARDRINKKITAAITYPCVIVVFFVVAIVGITVFLVPRFKDIYQGFGATLPPLTLAVFKTSDFIIRNIIFISGITATVLYFLHRWLFRTKKGRLFFDTLTLNIPIFGDVMKKAAVSKFSRTLSTLLGQGIPVPESLELVGRTSGSVIIENASLKAAKLILDGERIPEAFKKAEIFPALLIQMASVGVESGSLPELLDKTADLYEDYVDVFVSGMSSLIEPILIIVLGMLLAVVIVALYLPIFKLGQAVCTK